MINTHKKYSGTTGVTITQQPKSQEREIRPIARAALHIKEAAGFPEERNWYRTDSIKNHFQERIVES